MLQRVMVSSKVNRNALVALLAAAAIAGCQCDDNLALRPGGLTGQVCHPDTGDGLPGAVVTVRGASNDTGAADQNGQYTFTRLTQGDYTVTATLGDITREFTARVDSGNPQNSLLNGPSAFLRVL